MATKRKLPLIASRPDDDTPPRPPSHWIGFGVVAIFTLWLPLAALAESMKRREIVLYLGDRSSEVETELALAALSDHDRTRLTVVIFALPMLALALASLGGGFLIGRYGGGAGAREAALAGFSTALVATALVWVASGVAWGALASIAVAAPFAAIGAAIGRRRP